MSGLTCTGAGLIALTAAGLAVKGMRMMRAREPRSSCRPVAGTEPRSTWGSVPVTVAMVVPAHNEAATIEQTIRSCLNQTYPPAQVIVVAVPTPPRPWPGLRAPW
jgi:Glycosyl transferase family 2